MTQAKPTNIAASIRQKLLNRAQKTGDDPNVIWTRYAIERLLYRLSVSEFKGEFVLKGAALFMVWFNEPHRPTMDLDLLGYGEDSSERMVDIFRILCRMDIGNDGLTFKEESIRVTLRKIFSGMRLSEKVVSTRAEEGLWTCYC